MTGQFLSVDPEVQQTQQAYLYVGDDPVNGADPSGMADTGSHGYVQCGDPDIVGYNVWRICERNNEAGIVGHGRDLFSFLRDAATRVIDGIQVASGDVVNSARWFATHSRQIEEVTVTVLEAAALAACTAASEGICGVEFASFAVAAAAGAATSVTRHAIAGGDQTVGSYAKDAGIGAVEGLAEEGLSELTSLGWEPGAHETTKTFIDLVRDWTSF